MKSLKIAVMLTALIISNIASAEHLNRGMGVWQRVEVAKNFDNPADHYLFLKNGGIFPGMKQELVYGQTTAVRAVIWSDYVKFSSEMANISLLSLLILLNKINMMTENSLGYIDEAKALEILSGPMITVGDMPDVVITFDTYHQGNHAISSITRGRHWLPAVGQWEKSLFINIPGYEPIPIRSTFCGNNISASDVVKFIKKLPTVVDVVTEPKVTTPKGSITNVCPEGSITNNCPKGSITNDCQGSINGQPQGSIGQPKGSINGSNSWLNQETTSSKSSGWILKTD